MIPAAITGNMITHSNTSTSIIPVWSFIAVAITDGDICPPRREDSAAQSVIGIAARTSRTAAVAPCAGSAPRAATPSVASSVPVATTTIGTNACATRSRGIAAT